MSGAVTDPGTSTSLFLPYSDPVGLCPPGEGTALVTLNVLPGQALRLSQFWVRLTSLDCILLIGI